MKLVGERQAHREVNRFQPTYEELKLPGRQGAEVIFRPFSAYLRGIETEFLALLVLDDLCFQPTYEELKQGHAQLGAGGLRSFQPTYEELKRF